jgi:hypothetical protein
MTEARSTEGKGLRIDTEGGRLSVVRRDSSVPIVVQNVHANTRPYLHPVRSPGLPVVVTENSPAHHPWQHGLYVGLNNVNGYGFWTEGLDPHRDHLDGRFHPRLIGTPSAFCDEARWVVETTYRDPKGNALLTEIQEWLVADRTDRIELDLVWSLAAVVRVSFGEYAYGGPFLRMPYTARTGGSAFSSSAQDRDAADGQRARWVAVHMPIAPAASNIMVVLMDHPTNFRHPVPWRVDHQLGVGPSVCVAGRWRLGPGERQAFRHQFTVLGSPLRPAEIDEMWREFAEAT